MLKAVRNVLLICSSSFAVSAIAETHAHIQVSNQTDGFITTQCRGHHHKVVGSTALIPAAETKGMDIYDKGAINCKALDQKNNVIIETSFDLSSGSKYSWVVSKPATHGHSKAVLSIQNKTGGKISTKCHDGRNQAAGSSGSIGAYNEMNIDINKTGEIHCVALDHHSKEILNTKFNIDQNNTTFTWKIE